jgi:hypothetical protein
VSHAPERKEKNCLNCGATVIGRFCHVCGQENIIPKEGFGKLVIHFFYDITHFDSKFFDTARYLFFKPGFLSKEWLRGRRASYLNPVRMYVFTSAIFFLIFFMVVDPKNIVHIDKNAPVNNKTRLEMIEELQKEYKKSKSDTTILFKKLERLKDTTKPVSLTTLDSLEKKDTLTKSPKTFAEYDSLQRTLPPGKRDGWFSQMIAKKFEYNKELHDNPSSMLRQWVELFLHKLPYLLFVSLPLFALILKLLYIRRGKEFYYADHAIFSIHHYIFSFILLLILFLFVTIYNRTDWEAFKAMEVILFILWPVHLYIAMLNFYRQGWFKTFIKFLLLNMFGFFSLLILFALFFLITVLQS